MARPQKISDADILSTMRAAVIEHGPLVSLDLVAEQLGVTAPALLKRFGTRQNLFLKALQPDEEGLKRVFAEPLTDDRLVIQLGQLIGRLSDHFRAALPCAIALRSCGLSEEFCDKKPLLLPAVDGATRWLENMRDRGLINQSSSPSTTGTAIVGAVTTRLLAAYLRRKPWPPTSQARYAKELAELFARALESSSSSVKRRPSKKRSGKGKTA